MKRKGLVLAILAFSIIIFFSISVYSAFAAAHVSTIPHEGGKNITKIELSVNFPNQVITENFKQSGIKARGVLVAKTLIVDGGQGIVYPIDTIIDLSFLGVGSIHKIIVRPVYRYLNFNTGELIAEETNSSQSGLIIDRLFVGILPPANLKISIAALYIK